jgi:plastocyanin
VNVFIASTLAGCLLIATASRATSVSVTLRNASDAPLEDAIVVFDPLEAAIAPAHATAIVDQVNKRFVPRVSVVQTGTAITFPNSDHIRHQVYSFSPAKIFNLKLYAGSPSTQILFDKAGLVVLGCNIHDSMVGFIAVVDTPYFAKSTSSGNVALDLPPGKYRMRVWHAGLAQEFAPRNVQIANVAQSLPVKLAIAYDSAAPAAWPE